MKTKEELQAIREAQKRLSWIENVKKVYNWDQERAEAEWAKIHSAKITIKVPNDDLPY